MGQRLKARLFLILALVTAPSFEAFAEPEPENGGGAKASQDTERLNRARAELQDRSRALNELMRHRVNKLTPESRKALQELRRTAHRDRDRVTRVWLKRHWGETLRLKEAQDELRVHARRVARLHRIAALAKDLGKDQVATRAEIALGKEQQRHQQHMEELRANSAKPAEAAPSEASGSGGASPLPSPVGSAASSAAANPAKAGGTQ